MESHFSYRSSIAILLYNVKHIFTSEHHIVDVFDALTADRPYKKAMPLEQALSILQQGSGSHFDPKIVTIFSQYAAIWYQRIYQQSEEDVEKALRQQVTQIFSA